MSTPTQHRKYEFSVDGDTVPPYPAEWDPEVNLTFSPDKLGPNPDYWLGKLNLCDHGNSANSWNARKPSNPHGLLVYRDPKEGCTPSGTGP